MRIVHGVKTIQNCFFVLMCFILCSLCSLVLLLLLLLLLLCCWWWCWCNFSRPQTAHKAATKGTVEKSRSRRKGYRQQMREKTNEDRKGYRQQMREKTNEDRKEVKKQNTCNFSSRQDLLTISRYQFWN